MKLSEIKSVLTEHQIQLSKSLGQNFLHDGNQLRRIVAAAELSPRDPVLEIGPGLGALTERLVAEAGRVLALEKDRRLFAWLQQRFAQAPNLTLIHQDALDYLQDASQDWGDWKLVANLPYSVATRILVLLAQAQSAPRRMVATVQLEVGRRMVAGVNDPDYGLLALLLQLRFAVSDWFKISASCFFPQPDIDSACVILIRRAEPLLPASQSVVFEKVVKRAFSQRRKMMLKLLKLDWPVQELPAAFEQLGLSQNVRAETVSLEMFVQLTRILTRELVS